MSATAPADDTLAPLQDEIPSNCGKEYFAGDVAAPGPSPADWQSLHHVLTDPTNSVFFDPGVVFMAIDKEKVWTFRATEWGRKINKTKDTSGAVTVDTVYYPKDIKYGDMTRGYKRKAIFDSKSCLDYRWDKPHYIGRKPS